MAAFATALKNLPVTLLTAFLMILFNLRALAYLRLLLRDFLCLRPLLRCLRPFLPPLLRCLRPLRPDLLRCLRPLRPLRPLRLCLRALRAFAALRCLALLAAALLFLLAALAFFDALLAARRSARLRSSAFCTSVLAGAEAGFESGPG